MHKLYIKQKVFKITDHYDVLDEAGFPAYQVDQELHFVGYTVHVKKHDGTSSFVVERRLMSWAPVFEVEFSGGKRIEIVVNFSWTGRDIDLISEDYQLKITGSYWDVEFEIHNEDKLVGKIYREFFSWADVYTIEVLDLDFEDELLAILIAIDNLRNH